jgi:hypothetical protein
MNKNADAAVRGAVETAIAMSKSVKVQTWDEYAATNGHRFRHWESETPAAPDVTPRAPTVCPGADAEEG